MKTTSPSFKPLLLVLVLLLAGCLTAPAADASHNETVFFEAPSELLSPLTRPHALTQLQALGVKALRVQLYWHDVAPSPDSARKPSFDATNPASYAWGQYDVLLSEAKRLKWTVLLTVTSPVPKWATAGHRDLLTSPDDGDFREFMTAVGRHFGPEVSLYAIWNEPNHPAFLLPQFNSNGQPVSPRIYRGLFQAGYEGLHAAPIAHPKVLMGETAPFGSDTLTRSYIKKEGLEHDVSPLAFLRGSLCLDTHYRRSSTCSELPAYGYAHHPYTTAAGPHYRPQEPDDVTIGVLSRLEHALDRAASSRAIPARLPIYITEFGIQSVPQKYAVSVAKQAEYDALSEYISWSNPRVASFSQYLLRDDPVGGKPGASVHGGFVGFQTGLEKLHGARKPLYAGFPVPLVVSRHGHSYSLWGLIRPANGPTKARVLVQPPGSHSYRVLKVVNTRSDGSFSLRSGTPGTHWRVSWRSPSGVEYLGPPIGVSS